MPGYTGYVPNLWMVQARSYSTATRTALSKVRAPAHRWGVPGQCVR